MGIRLRHRGSSIQEREFLNLHGSFFRGLWFMVAPGASAPALGSASRPRREAWKLLLSHKSLHDKIISGGHLSDFRNKVDIDGPSISTMSRMTVKPMPVNPGIIFGMVWMNRFPKSPALKVKGVGLLSGPCNHQVFVDECGCTDASSASRG